MVELTVEETVAFQRAAAVSMAIMPSGTFLSPPDPTGTSLASLIRLEVRSSDTAALTAIHRGWVSVCYVSVWERVGALPCCHRGCPFCNRCIDRPISVLSTETDRSWTISDQASCIFQTHPYLLDGRGHLFHFLAETCLYPLVRSLPHLQRVTFSKSGTGT